MKFEGTFLLLVCLAPAVTVRGDDFATLCRDRSAIEHVYYNHRIGAKPPFEQALPPAVVENLVRQDLRKETALKQAYGVEITPALLDAEVRRIISTTRAPDMLAEINNALGNDPVRFANIFAKPILTERLLREKFDNDDALHAPQRRQAEQARGELLAARNNGADSEQLLIMLQRGNSNAVTEITWQLAPRPIETNAPAQDEIEIKQRFGPDAQVISAPPGGAREQNFYFDELPGELQNVLRAQLRKPGDITAVIETPGGFLLYLARAKTDAALSVAGLSLPKRSYEQWLAEQSQDQP